MKYSSYRDNAGRATVAIEGCPLFLSPYYSWLIRRKFSLKKYGKKLKSIEERSQKYEFQDSLIAIEWDNWSGFSVVAVDSAMEEVVLRIGQFLKTKCK